MIGRCNSIRNKVMDIGRNSILETAEIKKEGKIKGSMDSNIEGTEKKKVIETYTPEETFQLGLRIGQESTPGQVYTLIGDLGVGKTVFTQGVAKGL